MVVAGVQPLFESYGLLRVLTGYPTTFHPRAMETLQVESSPAKTSRLETPRRALRRDASNFDDYLVIGLVIGVFAVLLALLVIL